MYCYDMSFFDIAGSYFEKAALDMLQKSVILLIIHGVVLAFSLWDKNSRFFVILAAIGVYSVYGSLSVRISLRRMENAVKKLSEVRSRQFVRKIDTIRENITAEKEIFIPEKENNVTHSVLNQRILQIV